MWQCVLSLCQCALVCAGVSGCVRPFSSFVRVKHVCVCVCQTCVCVCVLVVRAGVPALPFLGFMVSFLSLPALLILYWLQLNMFTLLGYLTIPTFASVAFGHSVFSALHAAGEGKPKKD